MIESRVVIFAGHYGSGKTNLAVNWAISLSKTYPKVVLADLDIVNPYFRTSDSEEMLTSFGVKLISSRFAGSNVDLPSVPSEAGMVFDDTTVRGVVDVGGDDRGALALGRYASRIRAGSDGDCSVLMVVNMYRPETRDVGGVLQIMNEIESASHVKFTGIANNSNVGGGTTAEDVLSSSRYAEAVAESSGLPLVLTSAKREIAAELETSLENVYPIDITVKAEWKI